MTGIPLRVLIRRARKARGLTQEALAELMEISQTTLSAYESGRERIPKGRALRLAKELALDECEVLDALSRAELVLRCCPAQECPTNVPFALGEEIAYSPTFFRAESVKRMHCRFCGSLTLQACPQCRVTLERGAACPNCGTFYVPPSVTANIAAAPNASCQQELDRERERRIVVMATQGMAPTPLADAEDVR